jgi:hypothetical protein
VYAAGTAVVIIGTGNHWVLDAVVGWVVVLAAWEIARTQDDRPASHPDSRQTARLREVGSSAEVIG